jgi:hypothetical protein
MTVPTGILFADPRVKPLSAIGQFQPGCYLLFFQTQTTTLAPVYADGNLTVPLSQTPGTPPPSCTAASDGRFVPIYMDPSVIYRCQMYSAGGILIEDTDPYVNGAGSALINAINSQIATINSQIATVTQDLATLMGSVPWGDITSVPAPVSALGASTPLSGTFWAGDSGGSWETPSFAGASSTLALTADLPGIGSVPVAVFNGVPVQAGHTYYARIVADILALGGAQHITTGTNTPGVTGLGSGINTTQNASVGDYLIGNTWLANSVVPGTVGQNLYANDNYCVFEGRFIVPAATSVMAFTMSTSTGSLTIKAGSFVNIIQIS